MTDKELLNQALEYLEDNQHWVADGERHAYVMEYNAFIDKLKQALAQPEQPAQQEWKLVPVKPTDEMLKAMDECSKEGYDERLYAGHAASVYMAAVDVAPTLPQRTWVGLTDEEKQEWIDAMPYDPEPRHCMILVNVIEAKLKEKNGG